MPWIKHTLTHTACQHQVSAPNINAFPTPNSHMCTAYLQLNTITKNAQVPCKHLHTCKNTSTCPYFFPAQTIHILAWASASAQQLRSWLVAFRTTDSAKHFLSPHRAPSTGLSKLLTWFISFNSHSPLWTRCDYCPHCIDTKTEAQRGDVTCLKPLSWSGI